MLLFLALLQCFGMTLRTLVVFPLLVFCLVLSNVRCAHCYGFLMGRMCHSSCSVYIDYCSDCYIIVRENLIACWIMDQWFNIRFVDKLDMLSSVHFRTYMLFLRFITLGSPPSVPYFLSLSSLFRCPCLFLLPMYSFLPFMLYVRVTYFHCFKQ